MGLHNRYEHILNSQFAHLAKGNNIPEEQVQPLTAKYESMMHALHKEQGSSLRIQILAEPEVQSFINEHAAILDSSYQDVKMSDVMRERLNRSDYIFSGIKTFHELHEAFPKLTDENGNRKSFNDFYNDVQKIDSTYNRNYLHSEYNFVNASADMAAKWERFAQDGDRYNLQYRTVGDDRVREEHAELDGITLPIDDPFWHTYYPPNGWNCRCTVVQVLKDKYEVTPHSEAMAMGEAALQTDSKGIFRFNSGIQQKAVPDYNPYTIRRCNSCDVAKGKTNLAYIPGNELCAACQLIRKCETQRYDTKREYQNGGKVLVHQLVNPNDCDYEKLMDIAKHFAKSGKEVKLTPKMSRPQQFVYDNIYSSLKGTKYEGKCPDLLIGDKWYEHEGYRSKKPKNAFRNMLNDGLKQSDRIIIDKPDLTEAYMKRILRQRIKEGQSITEVWLKEKESVTLLYKKSEE